MCHADRRNYNKIIKRGVGCDLAYEKTDLLPVRGSFGIRTRSTVIKTTIKQMHLTSANFVMRRKIYEKSLFAMALALCMICVLVVPVGASAAKALETKEKIVESEGFAFDLKETIDQYDRVIRSYKRENTDLMAANSNTDADYAQTKALLLALGMEKDFVQKLSDETLQIYATSPELTGIISYIKVDAENNVIYMDEATATQEAKLFNSTQSLASQPNAGIQLGSRQGQSEQGQKEDAYMRVFYMVSPRNDGNFVFSTDARWLTMPYFRMKDSIGSCAQNTTVTPESRHGWYSYDMTYVNSGRVITDTDVTTFMKSNNFSNAVNGNWYGSAAVVDLPSDDVGDPKWTFKNFKAHYQYTGHVNFVGQEQWFNTVATYCHTKVGVSGSVSIVPGKSTAVDIGIGLQKTHDSRSIELEVHYIP